MILVSSYNSSEVLKPTDRSLNFPAATVSAKRAPVLRARLGTVFSMGANQLDTTAPKPFTQRIAVSRRIVDQSPRLSSQNSIFEQRLNKSYFVRTSARRVDAERDSMTVGKDHNLGALAPFRLANLFTPFFADENVPSANDSSRSIRPSRSSRRANRAQAFFQIPARVHARWRRQQVVPEGKHAGMSFHLAPVRSIQRIPSKQRRDAATGRPPLGPTGDSRNRSSINSHCSSVSSNSGSILDPLGDSTAGRDRFFMSASFRLHSIRQNQHHGLASNSGF